MMGANYAKALMWPVVVLLVILVVGWAETELVEGVGERLTLAIYAPMLVVFGVWAGWGTIQHGGKIYDAAAVGIVLWAWCAVLDLVLYAYASDFGFDAVWPEALGGSSVIFFGALIGGGWATTKPMAGAST